MADRDPSKHYRSLTPRLQLGPFFESSIHPRMATNIISDRSLLGFSSFVYPPNTSLQSALCGDYDARAGVEMWRTFRSNLESRSGDVIGSLRYVRERSQSHYCSLIPDYYEKSAGNTDGYVRCKKVTDGLISTTEGAKRALIYSSLSRL